jgi:bacillithiol system protein YtxJ
MKWNELTTTDQFKDLLEKEPVFAIFKHSTRCSPSKVAKNRVEREWQHDFPIYYLDLLRHRDVSNLIEKYSGVRHESPQLIVFQNGRPIYHASHHFIFVREIDVIAI